MLSRTERDAASLTCFIERLPKVSSSANPRALGHHSSRVMGTPKGHLGALPRRILLSPSTEFQRSASDGLQSKRPHV